MALVGAKGVVAAHTTEMARCTTCVTPQYANLIRYLAGAPDEGLLAAAETDRLRAHIDSQYGEAWPPSALLFFKVFPAPTIFNRIRALAPQAALVLLTCDLHTGTQTARKDLDLADYIVAATDTEHFVRFFGVSLHSKILHAGNRCPDEFAWPVLNSRAKDTLFYYGVKYGPRARFLAAARGSWPVTEHAAPPGRGYGPNNQHLTLATSAALYECAYAFTTGYDFGDNPKDRDKSGDLWYLVSKFFEIMGTGCLLVCDDTGVRGQLEALGFLRDLHYMHVLPAGASEARRFVVSNPAKVLEMRERAHKRVLQRFTVRAACADILSRLLGRPRRH